MAEVAPSAGSGYESRGERAVRYTKAITKGGWFIAAGIPVLAPIALSAKIAEVGIRGMFGIYHEGRRRTELGMSYTEYYSMRFEGLKGMVDAYKGFFNDVKESFSSKELRLATLLGGAAGITSAIGSAILMGGASEILPIPDYLKKRGNLYFATIVFPYLAARALTPVLTKIVEKKYGLTKYEETDVPSRIDTMMKIAATATTLTAWGEINQAFESLKNDLGGTINVGAHQAVGKHLPEIIPFIDVNENGLGDDLERMHYGNLDTVTPTLDTDNDGIPDVNELARDKTHPFNPSDHVQPIHPDNLQNLPANTLNYGILTDKNGNPNELIFTDKSGKLHPLEIYSWKDLDGDGKISQGDFIEFESSNGTPYFIKWGNETNKGIILYGEDKTLFGLDLTGEGTPTIIFKDGHNDIADINHNGYYEGIVTYDQNGNILYATDKNGDIYFWIDQDWEKPTNLTGVPTPLPPLIENLTQTVVIKAEATSEPLPTATDKSEPKFIPHTATNVPTETVIFHSPTPLPTEIPQPTIVPTSTDVPTLTHTPTPTINTTETPIIIEPVVVDSVTQDGYTFTALDHNGDGIIDAIKVDPPGNKEPFFSESFHDNNHDNEIDLGDMIQVDKKDLDGDGIPETPVYKKITSNGNIIPNKVIGFAFPPLDDPTGETEAKNVFYDIDGNVLARDWDGDGFLDEIKVKEKDGTERWLFDLQKNDKFDYEVTGRSLSSPLGYPQELKGPDGSTWTDSDHDGKYTQTVGTTIPTANTNTTTYFGSTQVLGPKGGVFGMVADHYLNKFGYPADFEDADKMVFGASSELNHQFSLAVEQMRAEGVSEEEIAKIWYEPRGIPFSFEGENIFDVARKFGMTDDEVNDIFTKHSVWAV